MNAATEPMVEQFDLIIIGAGISGLGMGAYMHMNCPDKSFLILEGRDSLGGTWDLFKYPGIRSDSDLHTFGFGFKPWKNKQSIASADLIMGYLRETAEEYRLNERIRFGSQVLSANWDSQTSLWTLTVQNPKTGETKQLTARWYFGAAGYYDYDRGYTPDFPGIENFKGQVIHPQHWPDNLDYAGKKVVVIGSGATAFTLIPAMAKKAGHITMLQRTPTYVISMPSQDKLANRIKSFLPEKMAHSVVRRKVVVLQRLFWLYCQKFPKHARKYLRELTQKQLPEHIDVDVHFNPPYNPWDQRLCLVPSGDFFKALRSGDASIVTDHIASFDANGLVLKSGQRLDADLIVTATGLNIRLMGGVQVSIDGQPVDIRNKVIFKGMMIDGIPNFAFSVGYTNSSWTLKVDLLCEHLTRIMKHMDKNGFNVAVAQRPEGPFETRPMLDFGAGYVQRALDLMPKQGKAMPWAMSMNYFDDEKMLRKGPVTDPCLKFSKAMVSQPASGRDEGPTQMAGKVSKAGHKEAA